MLVGSMNHPALPLEEELERIDEAGFDFVDLTLEPPGAWPADGAAIGRRLRDLGLPAVGHTAAYLPLASPFRELREQARRAFGDALEAFAAAGVTLVNVHPDPGPRHLPEEEALARNAEAIAALADDAAALGLEVMVENLGRSFATREELQAVLEADERLRFHLDVGHAHLWRAHGEPDRTRDLLAAFGDRLAHVHVHDNLGGDDLHLPLGVGSIDWPDTVAALQGAGWDGTVTLEIFAPQRAHLETSRRLWLEWWAAERARGGRSRPSQIRPTSG